MADVESTVPAPIYRAVKAEDFHCKTYQESFLALRDGVYSDFPAVFSLETLSLCNAACNFCPYPVLTRKGEAMPDALIEKILSELEEIPDRPPFQVTLSRVNEPFLDHRILDLSMDIERRFPEASHMFFSNATPLTERTLLGLSALNKVEFLMLSVNEHRAQKYEEVMQLPFEKTIARLNLVHDMVASGILKFRVYVSRVGDGTVDDQQFLDWVRVTYPSLSGLVTVRGNWMGMVPVNTGPAPSAGCRQWFQLHLLANGKAAFCCVDSDGRHGTGDARTQHVIHEIYNHPARRRLREESSRLKVAQCRWCAMLP